MEILSYTDHLQRDHTNLPQKVPNQETAVNFGRQSIIVPLNSDWGKELFGEDGAHIDAIVSVIRPKMRNET